MKKRLFFLPMLAILFWSQLGWAETEIKNTFGLGPRAGYYQTRGSENGTWYGGIQARFRLGEYLGLEAAADYRQTEKFKVSGPGFSGDIRQHSFPITGSLLVFLPILPHFSPYLVGGGGMYFTKIDYSSELETLGFHDRTERIWGWHAGAGLEFPITEHVALNTDFRWIFLDSKFGTEGGTDLDRDRKADGYVGTAALMFYF
jgi:opacity protein-like surface antigen